MITRVRKIAIAAPMPMAIAVRPRRRDSQIASAISAAVTIGTIHTSRSNHLTASCAGPSASDWIRVICPKSDGSGLPDQFATSWMEASGSAPGSMTGGEKRLESPPGSLPVHPRQHLADERQQVELHVAAGDVRGRRFAAQQGDDLLVADLVDLEPELVGLGRAQDLVGALDDEVLDGAGDRTGEELRLVRQGVAHALLQVGGGHRLAGDVGAQVLDGLRILADRSDDRACSRRCS